nr:hypothetical protein [Chloroflexota bacterium]
MKSTRSLKQFLAIVAVGVCAIISALIWQAVSARQPMWPLPALYLLEMVALSLAAALGNAHDSATGGRAAWGGGVGAVLAFVAMGAWSVGFLHIPVAVLLIITGILRNRRQRLNMAIHLGICAAAAVAQVALMLAVIRVL